MHRTLAIASSYSCREHSTPGRYEFNHFAHYGSTYTISAGVDQRFLIPFTFAVPCPSSLYVYTNCTVQLSFCVLSINFAVSLKFFYFYNFLSFTLSTLPEGDVISYRFCVLNHCVNGRLSYHVTSQWTLK